MGETYRSIPELSIEQRDVFFNKCLLNDQTGCLEWLTPTSSGYGTFLGFGAHRVSYTMANGPIPNGLIICHKCNNKSCVNPDHLYAGTHKQNAQDVMEVRYPNGHPLPKKVVSINEEQFLKLQKFSTDDVSVSMIVIKAVDNWLAEQAEQTSAPDSEAT